MDDKWNNEEEWEEESSEPLDRKLMVMIVLGMAVLAGVICTGLWYFTHVDRQGEEGQNFVAQATESSKPSPEPTLSPVLDSASGSPSELTYDAASTQMPEAASGAVSTQTPEATSGVVPTQTPETSSGAASTQTSETPSGAAPIQTSETPSGVVSTQTPETSSGSTPTQTMETPPGTASTQTPEITPKPAAQAAASGSVQGVVGQGTVSGTGSMKFTAVKESVMPKEAVNLRSAPTTTDDGNIVIQIQNGEVIIRTGINENTGWSEVEYQGQVLYAVSQYLTADLNYQPPKQLSDPNRVSTISGRVVIFTDCDDWISPKEYVNLRTEPSTDEGDDTVSCQLYYGEKVHRTGDSEYSGWSRVEHNGQVLYVVTSFMLEDTAE